MKYVVVHIDYKKHGARPYFIGTKKQCEKWVRLRISIWKDRIYVVKHEKVLSDYFRCGGTGTIYLTIKL